MALVTRYLRVLWPAVLLPGCLRNRLVAEGTPGLRVEQVFVGRMPDEAEDGPACESLRLLVLDRVHLDDADGDGRWLPGENLRVYGRITNPESEAQAAPELFVEVLVGAPTVRAQPPVPSQSTIDPGEPMLLVNFVHAAPQAQPGQPVELRVRVSDAAGLVCGGVEGATLRLRVD
jgi:hypothetical protein